jgi:hypothetical protein
MKISSYSGPVWAFETKLHYEATCEKEIWKMDKMLGAQRVC